LLISGQWKPVVSFAWGLTVGLTNEEIWDHSQRFHPCKWVVDLARHPFLGTLDQRRVVHVSPRERIFAAGASPPVLPFGDFLPWHV